MGKCQSEFATELRTPQTGIPCSVTPISRQPKSTAGLQLLFDQLFTWPTDQPRHATLIDDDPVKSDRPRFRWKFAGQRISSLSIHRQQANIEVHFAGNFLCFSAWSRWRMLPDCRYCVFEPRITTNNHEFHAHIRVHSMFDVRLFSANLTAQRI